MTGGELRELLLGERRAAAERAADDYGRKRSRAWVDAVEERVALSPADAVALEHVVTVADRIVDLEAAVESGGLVVTGSTGQVRLHPALGELRSSRSELRELLAALRS